MALDPITAVSLAVNVVQFVDFSSKLIAKSYEIYESVDGSSVENQELEAVVISLRQHVEKLSRSSREASRLQISGDNSSRELFDACEKAARELIDVLENIKVKGPHRKWKTVEQALRSYWSQEKIERLEKRILRFRDQIAFLLITNLSAEQPRLHASLEELQNQNGKLRQKLENDNMHIMKELRIISSIQIENQYADKEQDILRISEMLSDVAREDNRLTLERRLIHSLRYSDMNSRHQDIAEAHTDTYRWIFDAGGNEYGDRLRSWLRNQNGVFWVAGKPGSGKSTLMKYLSNHNDTKNILRIWAKPYELALTKFFFWNPGTTMQKSQLGLLQSILYEILEQCPHLIPIILPLRWQSYTLFGTDLNAWALPELCKAFEVLNTRADIQRKFCFFIDGLDEFDGDHDDLVKVIQSLVASESIKVCVSSREWNVFQDAFITYPKILMQDVTFSDIAIYIEKELGENPHFKLLKQSEPQRAPELVLEIVEKASGVFLWVFLVVRSLKEGLSNADRICDLRRRLRELPSDLEKYFAHILDRTDTFYFIQATQLFRLVLEAKFPLYLFELSFYDEEDPDFVLKMKIQPLSPSEVNARCDGMRRRIQSRCKGLLEIRESRGHPGMLEEVDENPSQRVGFLHRSVRDFLIGPTIYHHFVAMDSESFKCSLVLMRTSIARIKAIKFKEFPLGFTGMDGENALFLVVNRLLTYARESEEIMGIAQITLLEDLKQTVLILIRQIYEITGRTGDSSLVDFRVWHELLFLDLAIFYGLMKYVDKELSQTAQFALNGCLRVALLGCRDHVAPEYEIYIRLGRGNYHVLMQSPSPKMAQIILEYGADPNQIICQGNSESAATKVYQTLWEAILSLLPGSNSIRQQPWAKVLKLLILHGANPLTEVYSESAIQRIRAGLPDVDSDTLDELETLLGKSDAQQAGQRTRRWKNRLSRIFHRNYRKNDSIKFISM